MPTPSLPSLSLSTTSPAEPLETVVAQQTLIVQQSDSPVQASRPPNIAIIGAGPAGLMAAQVLAKAGYPAQVFDAMPSAGRKFLQAGRGGLNLTHNEAFETLTARYFEAQKHLTPALENFTPTQLRHWAKELGFETFVGSSGKVYPLDKKAAPLLRAWLQQLKRQQTVFHMKHRWTGWQAATATPKTMGEASSKETAKGMVKGTSQVDKPARTWQFTTPDGVKNIEFDAVILALGGASWPHLGSTGEWLTPLSQQGIRIRPLEPANMGFDLSWSSIFKAKFAGTPLKNIELSFTTQEGKKVRQLGELLMTEQGVEGSLIYSFSKFLREKWARQGSVTLHLDLFPHRTEAQLTEQLSAPQGKQSLSSFWKRQGLSGIKASLLREVLNKTDLNQPGLVAATLKQLPLNLLAPRPLAEAISTAGGVEFSNVNSALMLTELPGVFCAGEMLDWEAPTGGYLLTAVMAQGKQAAEGVLDFMGVDRD